VTSTEVSPSPIVDILDVGHGSCVVIRCGDDVVLIDAGSGGPVLEYLRSEGIDRIHAVLVSHADADHIGGISAILSQGIAIDQVVWNGDSMKQSTIWKDLVYQLAALEREGRAAAQQNAHDGFRIAVGSCGVEILVLAPGLILRQLGAGSTLRDGRAITSNSVSVVAQVVVDGEPLLLVPGDLDQVGYDQLTACISTADLKTKYLVLPHHGGLLGSPAASTAATITALVSAVSPEEVFVSNGRGRFGNPRIEVVNAVRAADPHVLIRCTQLSALCAVRELVQSAANGPYSAGWLRGHSCQGSVRLSRGNGIGAPLDRRRHIDFITSSVPLRICV